MGSLGLADQDDRLLTVFARRHGRTWAGLIAVVGALGAMGIGAVAPYMALGILGSTWVAAGLAYGADVLAVRRKQAQRAERTAVADGPSAPASDGANESDAALRCVNFPATAIAKLAALDDLAVGSIAWPLAGLTLLAPLSIHFMVYVMLWGIWAGTDGLEKFGAYMTITSIFLIPAYAALIGQAIQFARRLTTVSRAPMGQYPGLQALVVTTMASLVPGVLLLGIPSVMVAATGLLFIPLSFGWIREAHRHERFALMSVADEVSEHLPAPTLNAAVELVLDQDRRLPGRLMALALLERRYAPDQIGSVLDELLGRDDDLTWYVLKACRRLNHRPPIEVLSGLAGRARDSVAASAVELMVIAHGPTTEPALLRLLRRTSVDVRVEVLRGLGKVGTRASIESIRALIDHPEIAMPTWVAYAAIERIKKRLPSAEPGQLSLAPDGAGELSLSATAGE